MVDGRFLICEGVAVRQIAARKKQIKSIDRFKFDETFLTERSVKFRHRSVKFEHRFIKLRHRSVKFRHVHKFAKLCVEPRGGNCYNPRHTMHGLSAARGAIHPSQTEKNYEISQQ
jgi:hypothetical protein